MSLLEHRLLALDALLTRLGASTLEERRRQARLIAPMAADPDADMDAQAVSAMAARQMTAASPRMIADMSRELVTLQTDAAQFPGFFTHYDRTSRRAGSVLSAVRTASAYDFGLFLSVLQQNHGLAKDVRGAFDFRRWLYPDFIETGELGKLGSVIMAQRFLARNPTSAAAIKPLLEFLMIDPQAMRRMTPPDFAAYAGRRRAALQHSAITRGRFYLLEMFEKYEPKITEMLVRRHFLDMKSPHETAEQALQLDTLTGEAVSVAAMAVAVRMIDRDSRRRHGYRNALSPVFRLQTRLAGSMKALDALHRRPAMRLAAGSFNLAAGIVIGMGLVAAARPEIVQTLVKPGLSQRPPAVETPQP